jgi:sugar lactone lactonase YvrE
MIKRLLFFSFGTFCCICSCQVSAQYLYTIAGGGKSKENLDPLKVSVTPHTVFVDAGGNVYFTDQKLHAVRKYDLATGKVNTVAGGNGPGFGGDNGPAIGAKLNEPVGIKLDAGGKNLYIGDHKNYRIRKLDLTTGMISTIAGKGLAGYTGDGALAINATLSVSGIEIDGSGNLYFADTDNHVVRKIDKASGIISTIAGNGVNGNSGDNGAATQASMKTPTDLSFDSKGNLYITDPFSSNVRKVSTLGIITTIAGTGTSGFSGDGGPAVSAQMAGPEGIAIDGKDIIYITDRGKGRIRKVDASGIISTFAGNGVGNFQNDGVLATATSSYTLDVAVDLAGNVYTAEGFDRIREINGSTNVINTIVGNGSPGYEGDNGPASTSQLNNPNAIVRAANGDLFVADEINYSVRKIDAITSVITTYAGIGKSVFTLDGKAATNGMRSVDDIAIDAASNIYVVEGSANRIRKIDATTGLLSTIAGTGTDGFSGDGGLATSAMLSGPSGICIDKDGNIFISDNNRVRKIDGVTKKISTVAGTGSYGYSGDGGPAISALLYYPSRLAADKNGNIYFSDNYSHRIRKIEKSTGILTTVAGKQQSKGFSGDGGLATEAQLNYPLGVSVDNAGNLYIADTQNSRIRKVDAVTGLISSIAGNGSSTATTDGILATTSSLNQPEGVTVDGNGRVYFVDTDNDKVKVIKPKGALITFTNTVAVYNGSPVNIEYTTDPAVLNVALTYNGTATPPLVAGAYEVKATSNDAQYEGNAFATFTIVKAPQVITFDALGPKALQDGTFNLTATTASNLPISYQIADPSIATISGNTVTLKALGTTTIIATQVGNGNYLPAESIQQTLTVVAFTKILGVAGNLAFGDVGINKSAEKKITISNSGTATLQISNVTVPNGFTVDKTSGQVAVGGTLDLTIAFNPTEQKAYTGKLVIISDATSGTNQVDVSGTGVVITGIEKEVASERLSVFPNPGSGVFFLSNLNHIVPEVEIIRSNGTSVGKVNVELVENGIYKIDLSSSEDGSYIIILPVAGKSTRIVKQSKN